jgi:hypothetical protein
MITIYSRHIDTRDDNLYGIGRYIERAEVVFNTYGYRLPRMDGVRAFRKWQTVQIGHAKVYFLTSTQKLWRRKLAEALVS